MMSRIDSQDCKISTGRHFQNAHHNTSKIQHTMLNLCGIVVAILKMMTGRNFSMSGINSGHHNLPTYEMSLKHNTAKIQHCSISKVAFDLFCKPVVSGRFWRLETS
jgi:hypothetical protein